MGRWPFARTPLSRRARVAVTVVNRSSAMRTGTDTNRSRNRSANLVANSAAGPWLPRNVRGKPTTISTASYSRTIASIRRRSDAFGESSFDRATVSTGVAIMPSGSLDATPTRTLPTSMPIRRPRPGSSLPGRSGALSTVSCFRQARRHGFEQHRARRRCLPDPSPRLGPCRPCRHHVRRSTDRSCRPDRLP